jgi:hypothetical protein
MQTGEKIKLFQEAFRGRTDVVPRYWKSRDGTKAGYSPICSNEWKRDVCKKPCRTCANASYIPLSATLLLDHFKGKHIVGCYPLLYNNTANFIACDLDDHSGDRNPLADLQRLAEVCSVQEVPLHALRSKSGNGFHAYLFFEAPVPAWKARAVYFALLREAQVIGKKTELSSFDKLIPDQDTLEGKKFGNLIALPFQGTAAKKRHTLFLDPETGFTEPVKDQWEYLKCLARWTEAGLDQIIKEWGIERGETRPAINGNGENTPGWITAALAGVSAGARDDMGTKLAGYFRRKALPDDVTLAILQLWNDRNQPPLTVHEIEKIVSSVQRYTETQVHEFNRSRQCRAID